MSELCSEVTITVSDPRVLTDAINYRKHWIVLGDEFGLWRPVIFRTLAKGTLTGVCSGTVLVPTKDEAYKRGKEIVDEVVGN